MPFLAGCSLHDPMNTQRVLKHSALVVPLVKRCRPTWYVSVLHACRSRQDQLVFALHAAVLASGYRLVPVGEQAQLEGELARSGRSSLFALHQHCLCSAQCT